MQFPAKTHAKTLNSVANGPTRKGNAKQIYQQFSHVPRGCQPPVTPADHKKMASARRLQSDIAGTANYLLNLCFRTNYRHRLETGQGFHPIAMGMIEGLEVVLQ